MSKKTHTAIKSLTAPTLVAISILLALVSITPTVQAQQIIQRFTLSVSPGTAYLKVKPGTTVIHTIMLRNKGSEPVTVTPRIVDFETDGTTGTPVLLETSTFPYLSNQAEVLSPISIDPDQQANVPFAIKAPENAPPQEYHLTILFDQQSVGEANASALVPSVGSNLIVLVSDADPNASLKVISLQRPVIVDSFRPLSFQPIAENLGQAAALASGSAVIRDWRGVIVAEMPIYPDVVLAQTTRELRAAQPAEPALPDDPKAAIATLFNAASFSYKEPMILGAYTVEFNIKDVTGAGETTTVQKFTVYAFPFSALAVGIVTALVLFGLRFIKKKG
ncbi:hypothetical protein KA012_04375 [Candidatus Woesebacteria bacterium]|nr:hypothetical protein [Candidatus Woesebacteria bacterium]